VSRYFSGPSPCTHCFHTRLATSMWSAQLLHRIHDRMILLLTDSLTDQSMLPFNNCFLLIYVLNIVMLAGNHALPMMLRFYIWLGTKIFRKGQMNETLHFLLDHPRRYVSFPFQSISKKIDEYKMLLILVPKSSNVVPSFPSSCLHVRPDLSILEKANEEG
jgi:hypothetical protein